MNELWNDVKNISHDLDQVEKLILASNDGRFARFQSMMKSAKDANIKLGFCLTEQMLEGNIDAAWAEVQAFKSRFAVSAQSSSSNLGLSLF